MRTHTYTHTKPLTEPQAHFRGEVIFHYNIATQSSKTLKLSTMTEKRVKSTDVLWYLMSAKISFLHGLTKTVFEQKKCVNQSPAYSDKSTKMFTGIQRVKCLKVGVHFVRPHSLSSSHFLLSLCSPIHSSFKQACFEFELYPAS